MNNLKISTRLSMLIGILSALLMVVGAIGLFGISQSNAALKTVYEDRTAPLMDLGLIIDMVNRIRTNAVIASSASKPEVAEKANADTLSLDSAIDKRWKKYISTVLTPQEKQLADTFTSQWGTYQTSRNTTMKLAMNGDFAAAGENAAKDAGPKFSVTRETLFKLIEMQGAIAKMEFQDADVHFKNVRMVSIGSIVAGVLFAFIFGLALVRGISRSLAHAMDAANAVAQGDLSHTIQVSGQDEVAQLLKALSAMQQSLAKVVATVRSGSEGVAAASAQIASGNHDLSARTESQASALEETAASMEELSSTVKQNADSARQANQLALNASTVAVRGGQVVAQVVDTMKGINDSSKRISDIIQVIDGIAFQTNILALNAAVEAARAGEQGRGFAVVASEVRSLAGRSADAAKEIKSLINASVERVEQGTTLVDQAGVTMTEVVGSIKRVTDLMGEISAASNEQSLGVAQVGEAVTQMDQATQQNAALVEEMAAAASSLKSQAQELVATVAVFKLSAGDSPQHGVAPSNFATRSQVPAHPSFQRTEKPRAMNLRRAAEKPKALPQPSTSRATAPKSTPASGDDDWTSF